MDRKGQASAEYLLLIVVILLVMGWLLVNVYQPSISATMDVSTTSDAKNAVTNIANAANLVYANGPGAKRTLSVYVPADGTFVSNNASKIIQFNSAGIAKPVNASTSSNMTIVNPAVNKGWYNNITVEWILNTNYITVTIA
ncbi:MAG: hypothetical protein ABFC91_06595 [Methanobacteriaceae archaeon]